MMEFILVLITLIMYSILIKNLKFKVNFRFKFQYTVKEIKHEEIERKWDLER